MINFVPLHPVREEKIMRHLHIFTLLTPSCLTSVTLSAKPAKDDSHIRLKISEKSTKRPVVTGTCQSEPIGICAVTTLGRGITMSGIPLGNHTFIVSYPGFETIRPQVNANKLPSSFLGMQEINNIKKYIVK